MEWKEVDIEQTSIEIIDGDRGKNYPKNNELTNSGYCLFLSAANVTKNGLQFSNNSFITKEKDALLRKGKLMPQDIVLTTRGTVGNVGFYSDDVPYPNMRINSGMVIIRPGEDFDTMFLYQYLRSCYFRAQITQFQSGSAQPQLPISTLQKMKVIKPDIAAQHRIASILSSLDRKIELNNKINADLEEMAQAIFKNWFVDFEPFKNGKFVDSELGMIPEGWKVGRLDEIADVVGGSTPSKAKPEYYTQKGIAWLTPKDLSNHPAVYTSRGEIDITEEGYNSTSTKLMPKGTILFTSRAPIGYISIAQNDICTNQGFKSVVPKKAGTCFLYCFLKYVTPEIENKSTGSTFKEASGSLMKSLQVIMPEKKVFEDFETIVSPLFTRIESLEKENSRLSLLRDTLIPRLMSGELEDPE